MGWLNLEGFGDKKKERKKKITQSFCYLGSGQKSGIGKALLIIDTSNM
jgi:hypothetical protein